MDVRHGDCQSLSRDRARQRSGRRLDVGDEAKRIAATRLQDLVALAHLRRSRYRDRHQSQRDRVAGRSTRLADAVRRQHQSALVRRRIILRARTARIRRRVAEQPRRSHRPAHRQTDRSLHLRRHRRHARCRPVRTRLDRRPRLLRSQHRHHRHHADSNGLGQAHAGARIDARAGGPTHFQSV